MPIDSSQLDSSLVTWALLHRTFWAPAAFDEAAGFLLCTASTLPARTQPYSAHHDLQILHHTNQNWSRTTIQTPSREATQTRTVRETKRTWLDNLTSQTPHERTHRAGQAGREALSLL